MLTPTSGRVGGCHTRHDERYPAANLPASRAAQEVTAAFDGGRLTSDGGALLLSGADQQLGLCATLAAVIPDHRAGWHVTHRLEDILRARIWRIWRMSASLAQGERS